MRTKIVDGVEYISIGETTKLIGRSHATIINWYAWKDLVEKQGKKIPIFLPPLYRFGSRQIRHFKKEDIPYLISFRDNIYPGMMAEYNRTRWGERGEIIAERQELKKITG